ncbi:MAG: cupredoxin domain-containing protein [Bdellovibrionales bacterium]|nr:cupredoxin domain-containing protein [Bdellovibrionales bacterium]
MITPVTRAWEVDLSRRQLDFNRVTDQSRLPASTTTDETQSLFGQVFDSVEPTQDIVILNTEKGFVPDTIRVKKGNSYRIHVVNVNQKDKNVSFVLDAFSEHHNTVYGQERVFNLNPKADGVFSYQCPETAVQGRVIVISNSSDSERKPASN